MQKSTTKYQQTLRPKGQVMKGTQEKEQEGACLEGACLSPRTLTQKWWRSLEATVRLRLKARGKRTPENSWLQGTLIDKSTSKTLHTYTETKFHPRVNKFQSKTYHANSPATQEHSPKLQYTGCPKSHQTHRHLKTHYWALHCTQREEIQLHPPEHGYKLP